MDPIETLMAWVFGTLCAMGAAMVITLIIIPALMGA